MSLSTLEVFHKTAALRTPAGFPGIQRRQHIAAPVHASSSAASWPPAGSSRPMLSSTLAIFAAFFRACSQAVRKTCQKVSYWQTPCRKSYTLQMTARGPRARLAELPKKIVKFCKWPAQRQSLLPVEELTAELCYESVTGSLVAQLQQQPDPAVLNASIKQSVRHFHMLGAIAPFAAASGGANTFLLLTKAMARFIKVSTHHKMSTLLSLFLALCV